MPASNAAATTWPASSASPPKRVPRSEADDRAEPPLLHQRTSSRAATPAAKAAAKKSGSSSGAAAHVRERQALAGLAPALAVFADDGLAADERQHRLGVVRDAAMARPLVGSRDACRDHRHAAEGERRVGRLGRGEPAVAEPRAGSDDPGADRADGHVVLPPRPGERGGRRDALGVRVEARRDRGGRRHEPSLAQRPHRVRERDRQRTAGELHVGDAQPVECGADRRELAVQGAADDRHPVSAPPRPRPPPRRRAGRAAAACTAAPSRARPPPAGSSSPRRQVRVEHVEAARAELELACLHVDEHLVLQLDGPGQRRDRRRRRPRRPRAGPARRGARGSR